MSHKKSNDHVIIESIEHRITIVRWLLLLFTTGIDWAAGNDFDYPPGVYLAIIFVILGLDAKKIFNYIKGKF